MSGADKPHANIANSRDGLWWISIGLGPAHHERMDKESVGRGSLYPLTGIHPKSALVSLVHVRAKGQGVLFPFALGSMSLMLLDRVAQFQK